MRNNPDKNLIEKANKGDSKAFSEIYFALRGIIYGFSSRMLGDFVTAEDVTQEVFLFFIENPHKFDAERGELLSFLCGVARNRILHRLRRDNFRAEILQEDLGEFDEPIDLNSCNPLKNLLDEELSEKVEAGIARLPFLQREVLVLREMEELSYEEIARITETEISAVKSRLFRARRNLAKELAPYWLTNEEKSYEMC